MLFSSGSKSNSCVGLLNSPPNTRLICCADTVAFEERWIWCRESMLVMMVPGGITFLVPSAWATAQVTCRPAVEGMLRMMSDPAAASPFWFMGFGPASAANRTWPLGISAAGASSAPKLAPRTAPKGLLKVPWISGPADHLLLAVCTTRCADSLRSQLRGHPATVTLGPVQSRVPGWPMPGSAPAPAVSPHRRAECCPAQRRARPRQNPANSATVQMRTREPEPGNLEREREYEQVYGVAMPAELAKLFALRGSFHELR